ncbi:MAG: adenosine deaminase [Anaerolineales bacterium]|uniref:adenosine deaminase n=1 Tax=Candidatus Desulfolinea nitratireducens TaxID=2841698 RepID=A0A8J6NHB0_9CHLR|nr:adenosine deaminase [Candidatus Desulfolinea nitratireducens]MBL6959479.1 adenosine deaminase [Anaerolineales bacterium]
MKNYVTTSSLNIFMVLPKVELHRHLEGSLRIETMLDISREHGITVPRNIMRLSDLVQIQDEEPYTFANFLEKFKTLRLFYRSPEVIERVTREAVEDAARDNIRYMELRFTPVALSRAERFPLQDVVDWVCESANKAAEKFGITVKLIASVNRHESLELAEQVAWIASNSLDKGIVALDIAGNEAEFSGKPFAPIFREAKESGLKITVHAGEWAGAENVREAIEVLGADRIGHGVRVIEDETVVAMTKERGTCFEVCVTSNHQSGVTPTLKEHPLRKMIEAGLNTTINTDDPSISRISLSSEFQMVHDQLGISLDMLKKQTMNAVNAAFVSDEERERLVKDFKKGLE